MASHTAEHRAAYLRALRLGCNRTTAAIAAGVDRTTPYVWMDEEPFKAEVLAAEAHAIATRLQRILTAAEDGDWRADAWVLERQFPDGFGKQRVELTGKDGGPLDHRVVLTDRIGEADDDTLRALAARVDE